MSLRLVPLSLALALCACKQQAAPSLVGEGAAPGIYALAGDTITVWRRVRLPDGMWRFQSWSITPGGTVEYLDTPERADEPTDLEETAAELAERRQSFALPQGEFEALRKQAALLRPLALGPDDPVRGYAGEAYPRGCAADKTQPSLVGINFLNRTNWGAFVLPPGCTSQDGQAASGAMAQIVARLTKATPQRRLPKS